VSVVESLIAALEARDGQAFAALYADDAKLTHPLAPEPLRGRNAIRASEEALFAAFSDIGVEVKSVVASGRDVAVELVLTATNTGPLDVRAGEPLAATNRRIEVPSAWFFTLDDDGRIASERDYLDAAGFMRQLTGE
jgi:steroid delta-isomerase-like uncharacterized protein